MKKYFEFCGYHHDFNNKMLESFNYNLIKEGLIKSIDYDISVQKIDDLLKKHKVKGSVKLYILKDRIELNFYGERLKEFYSDLLILVNNLGYNISNQYMDGKKTSISTHVWKKDEDFIVYLNKRFDSEVGVPEKLYHVTNKKNLDKIKKQGIVPKTKNVIEQHPERIYLFGNEKISKNYLEEKEFHSKEEYIILEIDMKVMINNIKLHKDPKFNEDSEAYYTYDNIPPNAIKSEIV